MRRQLQQSSRERIIIGGNKSLGCIFSEKPADRTNLLKLEISSLTDFMTCFFVERFESKRTPRFLAESEKGML